MKRRRLFLVLASGLAVAWTAWLGYQALTTADPIVVSRPQIMAAPVVVVAELRGDADPRVARVIKVYRGQELLDLNDGDQEKGKPITVRGLHGIPPGEFILPLQPTEIKAEFEVMRTPPSPGFAGGGRNAQPVYPVTPSTELQVREALRQFQRALKQ